MTMLSRLPEIREALMQKNHDSLLLILMVMPHFGGGVYNIFESGGPGRDRG